MPVPSPRQSVPGSSAPALTGGGEVDDITGAVVLGYD
jgi:hypothetical protein